MNGDIKTVNLLKNCGAELNERNKKGQVAIHYWIRKRNLNFVEEFLQAGADPNFTDDKERNTLHHAVNNAEVTADASFELEAILV